MMCQDKIEYLAFYYENGGLQKESTYSSLMQADKDAKEHCGPKPCDVVLSCAKCKDEVGYYSIDSSKRVEVVKTVYDRRPFDEDELDCIFGYVEWEKD